MTAAALDHVYPPGQDPGLWTAEQLVAAEAHQICSGGQRAPGIGLIR